MKSEQNKKLSIRSRLIQVPERKTEPHRRAYGDADKKLLRKCKKTIDIFLLLRYHKQVLTPGWCNGSTGDSGSSCLGSSPSPGAIFLSEKIC